MPQVTLEETTLRFGAMAVGALRKAYSVENPGCALTGNNRHYLNAIVYYCEALRLQSKAKPTKEGLRTALLSSLLFICFESQRGNMPAALKHVTHGFSMLNELATCTENAPNLVSIAAAPPILVQEILDCYKPLELQSRSFIGSYQKFFFPPKPPQPAQGTQPLYQSQHTSPEPSSPDGPATNSPPSQPGTPWQGSTAQVIQPVGLPSPQSQGSPRSQSSPQSQNGQLPPKAPLSRPPSIAPFTKHSPYFRPKLTRITRLEDMPPVFETWDEMQDYWSLVQRQMVVAVPKLTLLTNQLALSRVRSDAELETKLTSIKQNPEASRFIAESRYWLQRWIEAFQPLYQSIFHNKDQDPLLYQQAMSIRIEYLILYIYTTIPRYSSLITAKGLTPQYREITVLAEKLLQSRPNCGFAMDAGWTWPLFVSAFGCRDPAVREEAIRILDQYPIRNALRDSRVFRAIAVKNRETELINSMEGDENEQWIRLKRRELVFEDFGTNIIFRSAQKDPLTGVWVTIEEAAEFTVRMDGLLDWRQQPITDSASILSGVC